MIRHRSPVAMNAKLRSDALRSYQHENKRANWSTAYNSGSSTSKLSYNGDDQRIVKSTVHEHRPYSRSDTSKTSSSIVNKFEVKLGNNKQLNSTESPSIFFMKQKSNSHTKKFKLRSIQSSNGAASDKIERLRNTRSANFKPKWNILRRNSSKIWHPSEAEMTKQLAFLASDSNDIPGTSPTKKRTSEILIIDLIQDWPSLEEWESASDSDHDMLDIREELAGLKQHNKRLEKTLNLLRPQLDNFENTQASAKPKGNSIKEPQAGGTTFTFIDKELHRHEAETSSNDFSIKSPKSSEISRNAESRRIYGPVKGRIHNQPETKSGWWTKLTKNLYGAKRKGTTVKNLECLF